MRIEDAFDWIEGRIVRLLCATGRHRRGYLKCGGWVCACGKERTGDTTYDWLMCEDKTPN